jgi:transposase InsO family protein
MPEVITPDVPEPSDRLGRDVVPDREVEPEVLDGENLIPLVIPADDPSESASSLPREFRPPNLRARAKGRKLVPKGQTKRVKLNAEQRILLLDLWRRSGLPAGDFAALVGMSKHTLYGWRNAFDEAGPAGLMDRPRGRRKGSRLPEVTKRAIVMLKQDNPDWGCERISAMLARGPALGASPSAVSRVLHEAGYELQESPTRPHAPKARRFERAAPNQLWQTDLFTFTLKRQNRRVYLVAFMDDHSRFITGFGLHSSQSAALVLEVLRGAITTYRAPEEILTDNGTQYVTWRGKSAFSRELDKHGIKHIVASPRRPQTLGKIERFWGTLWRELVETAVFLDLEDARKRIGHFIDYYNFHRIHTGIDRLVPADRFFGAESEVKATLKARVKANALDLAKQGMPKNPFYVTGQSNGKPFSVHTEGERVIFTRGDGEREEVELVSAEPEEKRTLPEPVSPDGSPADEPATQKEPEQEPGKWPMDDILEELDDVFGKAARGEK